MRIEHRVISGVYTIDSERFSDDRGYFFRTYCQQEFSAAGIEVDFVQSSLSFNAAAGTLRGMHLQTAPHGEHKLVRCVAGAIYDVALDLRPESPTFLRWESFELQPEGDRAVLIPPGVAHGFQSLVDNTLVAYQIDAPNWPQSAAGVRWNDPVFDISWPANQNRTISERDELWPDYDPAVGIGQLV